ncbi:ABC transporter ATP-binding protein [Paramicrobacterium chengjingii]|uniref:ABC transporter ATP-binding protein n=1 Tax=Paramicrobacterium chengjingii TaxID=2769067 RepID=A0ABX6YGL7_9MICO|nr:ABC transporter ATP-binding protein [Microbacterium chengjingii]QPZ37750.1 ABC transporter ATP-binding protein [Microbacterium chengjingii]
MTLMASERLAHTGGESRALDVKFSSVARSFPDRAQPNRHRAVLSNIDLTVNAGEIVAIIGASGCGKSTLLRLAGGLGSPTAGSVTVDGTPVDDFDARTAVGFQEARLLPWRTITRNVALGLPPHTTRSQGEARVQRLIELVGLSEFADHKPREISGGMAQRTSLARALARNPGVLLLDEPFGALDALTRIQMQDLLLNVHAAEPTTVILVTHDVDEAVQLADRVVLLGPSPDHSGAGIQQIFAIDDSRPRDRASADLAKLRDRMLSGLGVTHR